MAWNDELTGAALDIAGSEARRLRVMAGPGTGKSFVMKRRVMRLLEGGQEPTRILAVTFTRTAAKDLISDLHDLGTPGCENIQAGTIHSACFRMLRRGAVFDYNKRHTRPLLGFELQALLHDIKGPFGGKRKVEARLKAFEAGWARLQTDGPGRASDEDDRRFQVALLEWLRFHRAMHIGEVVPLALDYLRNNPDADELSAYDHVIVDEYQDLNKAEQVLISRLADKGHCAVVGDVDQSIYAFRHAHPEGIIEFAAMHAGTIDHELVDCRRCPTTVAAIADSLIRNNHDAAAGPRLREGATQKPGEVVIVQWPGLAEEVDGIAELVKSRIGSGRYSAADFLVLCPRRDMGYDIRDRLVAGGIAAHSFFSEEILDSPEAQQAFAFLSLLAEPDDRVSLRFLLGRESASWRSGEYAKLRARSSASDESPRQLLEKVVAGVDSNRGISHLVEGYRAVRGRLEPLVGLAGPALRDAIFPEAEEWARPIREAIGEKVAAGTTADELRQKIVQIATQPDMPPGGKAARIMSLHKSKGLSSTVVVMVGCNEGMLPAIDRKASGGERDRQLQEQRRLFYVGMTRAKETLVLSSSATSSRFLSELGSRAPKPVSGDELLAAASARREAAE